MLYEVITKSIYENIAWGARIHGYKGKMDELVEYSLKQAALWDEVKDKLDQSGLALSGGQQQRPRPEDLARPAVQRILRGVSYNFV